MDTNKTPEEQAAQNQAQEMLNRAFGFSCPIDFKTALLCLDAGILDGPQTTIKVPVIYGNRAVTVRLEVHVVDATPGDQAITVHNQKGEVIKSISEVKR